MQASHSYVQNVRHACAEQFLRFQLEALHRLGRADTMILEVALDETEEPTRVDVRAETVHMMTVHARLFHRRGQETKRVDIVMPMATVESTASEALKAALWNRLPMPLQSLAQRSRRFAMVLNTDSGAACLKLGRHMSTVVPTLQSPCRMHQVCLAMISIFSIAGTMSALFCATLLLRRRRVQSMMRTALRRHINENFKISYEAPSAADRNHIDAVLGLLERNLVSRLHRRLDGSHSSTQRLEAWARLKQFLSGPLDSPQILHYCPHGCHKSVDEAKVEPERDLITVFFDHPPPVPAWNKWSKIVPPLTWLSVFMSLNMLLPGVVTALTSVHNDAGQLDFDPEDLLGMDSQRAFLRQEHARFTKTQRFLTAPVTRDKLMACTLVLQPALDVLSACFVASRRHLAAEQSVEIFIHERTSPALQVIRRFCKALNTPDHQFWRPLLGSRVWSERMLLLALVPTWTLMAQLHQRLVQAFRCWPWRLALLTDDGVPQQVKVALAEELISCCEHTDPFTKSYRRGLHVTDDVLAEDNMTFTRDLFKNTPVSNITSEA